MSGLNRCLLVGFLLVVGTPCHGLPRHKCVGVRRARRPPSPNIVIMYRTTSGTAKWASMAATAGCQRRASMPSRGQACG